jgi:epoxyqueuosine reductase
MPAMASIEERLKAEAAARGFALAGIATATDADTYHLYERWLARGFAGEMHYLYSQGEARKHPHSIHETARSVLMLGMEYGGGDRGQGTGDRGQGTGRNQESGNESADSLAPRPSPLAPARVAAYAQGPDYHRYIWDRINDLSAWLERETGCRTEAVADTAPLLERDFARRAGLGWVGKNTMLIHPRRGSFFFLAAILTDLELKPDAPFATSHCGTCTACLDACPTKAFPEPFVLNATQCISYLTVELRTPIPLELREPMGNWLYGCDVCQDVCPWNRKPRGEVAFPHVAELEALDPVELLSLDAVAFRARFRHTSLWRNKRAGLLRNAAIVLGNVGDARALPALERACADEEPLVREAAAWALARVRQRYERV